MIVKTALKLLWKKPSLFLIKLSDFIKIKKASLLAIISPSKNPDFDHSPIIYIKTPKCASSAIVAALESKGLLINMLDHANKIKPLEEKEIANKIICVGSYTNKKWFKKKYSEIWKKAYKWAVVRHPYSKTISAWKYLDNLRNIPLVDLLQNPPIEKNNFSDYLHFTMTQSQMLIDEKGNIEADLILKFENLKSDWEVLKSELDYKLPNLDIINKTVKKESSDIILDEETKLKIRKNYNEDFKNFDFK